MSALNLRCPALPDLRIAFIGLGHRGMKTLARYVTYHDIHITALCDVDDAHVREASDFLRQHHRQEATCYSGPEGWKRLCEWDGYDLLFICTDWVTHTPIACRAMECGKHVAIEVPAAMTVDDCWALVETAEKTQRHCIMVENCCYDAYNLMALNLIRQGRLGELTHAEGAYIHDLREEFASSPWMQHYNAKHLGNFYPTHGLGPICQQMGIHRGDTLKSLTSVSSTVKQDGLPCINNTLITTERGRTILLQYDPVTPRPYSRIQMTCGTRGFIRKYPQPVLFLEDEQVMLEGAALEQRLNEFAHPWTRHYQPQVERLGVTNEMNFIMDRRLIFCLRQGLPLDMDVYDAAEWSCITELSETSVLRGGAPIEIPNFLRSEA